mgnify:CR=1 FL=1
MLVRSRYTKGIQSLVGVVTTQENASPILEELKKDWSKRVTGLAILEAAPEQLHTEIDGVKIEANFDNFMDWLRQAALDEVYLDIAQESEENIAALSRGDGEHGADGPFPPAGAGPDRKSLL